MYCGWFRSYSKRHAVVCDNAPGEDQKGTKQRVIVWQCIIRQCNNAPYDKHTVAWRIVILTHCVLSYGTLSKCELCAILDIFIFFRSRILWFLWYKLGFIHDVTCKNCNKIDIIKFLSMCINYKDKTHIKVRNFMQTNWWQIIQCFNITYSAKLVKGHLFGASENKEIILLVLNFM